MKVAWNTCERNLVELSLVPGAMKTTTKSLCEYFQRKLPFRESYVKYLENNSLWLLHSFLQYHFVKWSEVK